MEFERWIDSWIPYLTPSLINVLKAINNNAFITKPELSETIGQGHTSISKYIFSIKGIGLVKARRLTKSGELGCYQNTLTKQIVSDKVYDKLKSRLEKTASGCKYSGEAKLSANVSGFCC